MAKKKNKYAIFIACLLSLTLPLAAKAQTPWYEYHDVIGETVRDMADARKDANAYFGLLATARGRFFNSEPGTAERKQATEDLKILLWRRDVIFLIYDLVKINNVGTQNTIRAVALEQADMRMNGSPAEQRFQEWEAALNKELGLAHNEKLWSLDDPKVQMAFDRTTAIYQKYYAAAFDWEWARWCESPRGSNSTIKKCEAITGITMAQREAKRKADEAETQRVIAVNAPKIAERDKQAALCRDDAWNRGLRGRGANMYVEQCFKEGADAITEQDLAKHVAASNQAKIEWARIDKCKPLMPANPNASTLRFSQCIESAMTMTLEEASARVDACNCKF